MPGFASVSVRTYGAIGDGSDQTLAIQKAIAAAEANCGSVYLPAGSYVTTGTLKLSCASIFGDAGMGTYLRPNGNFDALVVDGDVKSNEGPFLTIANFFIFPVKSQSAGAAIRVRCNYVSIDKVRIDGSFDGILWERGQNLKINDVEVRTPNRDIATQAAVNLTITNSELELGGLPGAGVAVCLEMTNTQGIQLSDIWMGGTQVGWKMTGAAQVFAKSVVVDVSVAQNLQWTNVVDAECVDCWAAGSRTSFGVDLLNSNAVRFRGGYIRSNALSGVHLGAGNANVGFEGVGFAANGMKHSNKGQDQAGIYVDGGVKGLTVVDSWFGDLGEDRTNSVQQYGLYWSTGNASSSVVVSANQVVSGKLMNSLGVPVVIGGNVGGLTWSAGDGAPRGTCVTGALYTDSGAGGLFHCAAGRWVELLAK